MPFDSSIPGHMGDAELEVIATWAESVPDNGVIVELGSMFGRSAVCWAMSAKTSAKIYCIDHWPHNMEHRDFPNADYNHFVEFRKHTEQFNNIIPIKGRSPAGITYPGDQIDVFFLDAAHENPDDWNNLEYFMPFVKSGGLICGHDYLEMFPAVIENVKRLEEMFGTKATLHPNGLLWSIVKP